jgi:hypothetical protein
MKTPVNVHTTAQLYIPIRVTEGRQWLDTSSAGLLREQAEKAIAALQRTIPSWDKVNPVLDIVRCTVSIDAVS